MVCAGSLEYWYKPGSFLCASVEKKPAGADPITDYIPADQIQGKALRQHICSEFLGCLCPVPVFPQCMCVCACVCVCHCPPAWTADLIWNLSLLHLFGRSSSSFPSSSFPVSENPLGPQEMVARTCKITTRNENEWNSSSFSASKACLHTGEVKVHLHTVCPTSASTGHGGGNDVNARSIIVKQRQKTNVTHRSWKKAKKYG